MERRANASAGPGFWEKLAGIAGPATAGYGPSALPAYGVDAERQ